MITEEICLNGVDPEGHEVPDEVLLKTESLSIEVIKCVGRHGYTYEVRHYENGDPVEVGEIEDFEDAFAIFAAIANGELNESDPDELDD